MDTMDNKQRTKHKLQSTILLLIGVLLLTILVYSNSFSCGWHLDDTHAILEFDYQNATPESVFKFSPQRSLGFFTFWLNYKISNYEIFSWHFINLLIHLFNVVLVYFLSLLVFQPPKNVDCSRHFFGIEKITALIIAAIFAVHPLQAHAVTYIVQRIELLGTTFVLLSFISMLKVYFSKTFLQKVLWIIIALLIMICGALTKETIAAAPVLCCLFLLLTQLRSKKAVFLAILIFGGFGVAAVIAGLIGFKALTFSPLNISFAPFKVLWKDALMTPAEYYPTQAVVLLKFLRMCIFPAGQCVEHFVKPVGIGFAFFAAIFVQLLIILFALFNVRRRPMILFGILWFYVFILPSSIMPNGVFEHRLYGPLIGILIAIAIPVSWEIHSLPARRRKPTASISVCLALCIIISFSFLTHVRNKVWKSELTLWSEAVNKYPENWRANANYGFALLNNDRLQDAGKYLEKSFQQKSNVYLVANNLGLFYFYTGQMKKSAETFNYALKLKPKNRMLMGNLGAVYLSMDEIENGTNLLEKARTPESFITLGDYYFSRGDLTNSLRCFERVLKKYPDEEDAKVGKAKVLEILIKNSN